MLTSRLTPRQASIVSFLALYSTQHGHSPSYREIADHFGIASPNGVYRHLVALKNKGAVDWKPKQCRTLTVTAANPDAD
jgi:repressor LexA